MCGIKKSLFYTGIEWPRENYIFSSESESDVGMENPANLTVGNAKRALVGVYDRSKRLLNFSYLQFPYPVGGLSVVGRTQLTELSWITVPGGFVKGNHDYGSNLKEVNAFTGVGSQ